MILIDARGRVFHLERFAYTNAPKDSGVGAFFIVMKMLAKLDYYCGWLYASVRFEIGKVEIMICHA